MYLYNEFLTDLLYGIMLFHKIYVYLLLHLYHICGVLCVNFADQFHHFTQK